MVLEVEVGIAWFVSNGIAVFLNYVMEVLGKIKIMDLDALWYWRYYLYLVGVFLIFCFIVFVFKIFFKGFLININFEGLLWVLNKIIGKVFIIVFYIVCREYN